MKRLHLLIFVFVCIGSSTFAQFRLADNIADAEFVCASELEWDISDSYSTEITDPTPACGADAINQSAWFKVEAMTTGTIELNFLNITVGQDYVISVYPSDGNETNPALSAAVACDIVNSGNTQVTFNYAGTEPSPIFYVIVDGQSDASGSITLSATGSAIASPGLVLTSSRVVGCWGELSTNLVKITNNSVDNGGNDEFELEITFTAADLEGVDDAGWEDPTVVSVNGVTIEEVIGTDGAATYQDYPRGAQIVLASGYPGTWEATLRPRNHECFDAAFNSTSTSSTVQRLVVRRTDENFNLLQDPQFCEQNDLSDWYGKAELLPTPNSVANIATIQSWSWNFKDRDGVSLGIVTDSDPEFSPAPGDINNSTAIIDFAIPDGDKDRFSIEIDVQGTCGPAERDYVLQAYVPQDPVITPVAPTCIDDISGANPITFSVTNVEGFSPKPISQPVTWDFGGLASAAVISGDNGETVTISDNSLFTPGTYQIEATLTDEGNCFTTTAFNVDIAAKAMIANLDTIPVVPNIQCNQFVFNQGDVVDFEFDVTDVLPGQNARVIITYNGVEIDNILQTADSVRHTFRVTHTGDENDLISISVDNETFPITGNCPTSRTIGMLLEKEEPILAIDGNSTVCISNVTGATPLRVFINNADNILGGSSLISTSWSIDDADAIVASENATEITYSSLSSGNHIITGAVSYNGGICFEEVSIPITVAAKATIANVDTIPVAPNVQCNQFVFNQGDEVDFEFDVTDVLPGQNARVIITYNGVEIDNILQEEDSVRHSFRVTHTGDENDQISISVDNETFPTLGNCPTTRTIRMLLEKEEPILAIEGNSTVCISDVNEGTPLRATIANADNILGGADLISTTWSIDAAEVIIASENATEINYSSLPVGTHIITAQVSYNGGICFEEITVPVTVVTQEEIVVDAQPTPIEPAVLNFQCNEVVYNEGDKVSFNATISKLVDPVIITIKRGEAILRTIPADDYEADSTFVVNFEVTHNGDEIDVITIEVANQTFPLVCTASQEIRMRLFQNVKPTISPINPVVCINNITNDNPVSFNILSPSGLPDINNIVWSVLDDEREPVSNIFTRQDNLNDVSMTGFVVGSYIVQADVNYVGGCIETVSTRLTVLGQPSFNVENITATTTVNNCEDPNGFQVGDQIQYEFGLADIQEPIEVVASFPGGSETFSVTSSNFNTSLNFTVIDEPLQADGITWIAGTINVTSQNGCEESYNIEIPVVPNPLEISPSQNQSVCVSGNSATLSIQVLSAPAGTPTFSWTGDNVPENSTGSSINLTDLQDGETFNIEANVTSADGICRRTVNFEVSVNLDLPELNATVVSSPDNTDCNGNTGFCRGDQVEIAFEAINPTKDYVVRLQIPGYTDGNGNPYDEEILQPASNISGSFFVTVEDTNIDGIISIRYEGEGECAQESEINVPIVPLAIVANADDNQTCSGELVREIGVIPSCEDYTVDWSNSPNQDLITSINGNNIVVDFNGRSSGFYTFEVEVTGNNCSRVISQTLEFSDNLPDQIVGPTGLTGFCIGDLPQNNILLTVGKSTGDFDESQVTFDWSATSNNNQQYIRAGTSLTGSSVVLDIPAGMPVGDYEFKVLVRDRDPDNVCEREMVYTLQIVDNETIQLTTSSPEFCDFSEGSITASGGLSGNYVWTRLDPETRQVVETYQETSATLSIVTNEAETMLFSVEDAAAPACIAGGELTLTVTSCSLEIPNAFTPGPEDEINATFEVPRIQNRDWDFIVYNRYGDIVYQNENYDNSWDGEELPEGIYYYQLTSPEKTQEYKGWVRILRNKIGGDSR